MNEGLDSWGVYTCQVLIDNLDQNKTTFKDAKRFIELCRDLSCCRNTLTQIKTKSALIKELGALIKEYKRLK